MRSLDVVRILALFSFSHHGELYPCALVRWFVRGDEPDEDTGMWTVQPGFNNRQQPDMSIIHLDTIYRVAHLIPVYGNQPVLLGLGPHNSYDGFRFYYINKFADHHAFEIAS
jgi:hypothetical protein